MNWEQKFAAIKAFAGNFDTSLMMRKPGDWYVSAGMMQGGDGMLLGTYGNGVTPEEAVNDHWRIYTDDMPADKYAVADRQEPVRRGRWNGFMWDMLTDEQAENWRENHRPRDSGSGSQSENSRSEVEAEGPQSGTRDSAGIAQSQSHE